MTDTLEPPTATRPDGSTPPASGRRRDAATTRPASKRNGRRRLTSHWARVLHVYTSMIALLVVLFFGATGITLNHPTWTFGADATTTTATDTLPDGWQDEDGSAAFLTISEYLRDAEGVSGDVSDYGTDAGTAWVSYRSPGYSADASVDLETGEYTLTVEQEGLVGVLNDLHKGRNADGAWTWLIDLSGGLLVVIAVTGIALQLVLPKRRRAALATLGLGALAALLLGWLTLT